jgi:hypothetical protein
MVVQLCFICSIIDCFVSLDDRLFFRPQRGMCHVIMHGFFCRSLFIFRRHPPSILSVALLPSDSAVLYYALDARLLLQPQPVPYSDQSHL